MHIGNNIRVIRELLGIKQEALAQILNISQQTVSKIEQTQTIREQTIEKIAGALGVPASSISQFSEERIVDFIKESYPRQKPTVNDANCNDYLIQKIIELYERLLLAERSK